MGLRGKPCPVCADAALLQQVNALLESGTGPSAIAKLTSVGKDCIQRHKKHAFQPVVLNDEPDTELKLSDARLSRWLERSEAAWVAASAQGDTARAVDALRSGIKAELEHHRRLEKREQQSSPDEESDGLATIKALDKAVAQIQTQNYAQCPACRSSWGDKVRVQRFATWLLTAGLVAEFQKWSVEVPYRNERKTEDEVSRTN